MPIFQPELNVNASKCREYVAWQNMRTRCYSLKFPGYKDYGQRGITVCDAWMHNFIQFYSDMGPKPTSKHSLDRINNDGNYEPSNCRWATGSEQARNKRKLPRQPRIKLMAGAPLTRARTLKELKWLFPDRRFLLKELSSGQYAAWIDNEPQASYVGKSWEDVMRLAVREAWSEKE